MEQEKKLSAIFYILIFVTVAMIAFAAISFKKPILSDRYIYTSPSGEQFEFFRSNLGEITQHVLTAYVVDDAGKHQYDVPFINDPYSLEDIPVTDNIKNKLLNKQGIYVTIDPNANSKAVLAAVEITRVIGTNDYGVFKIPTQAAVISQTNTSYPVITCNNANLQTGVIYLKVEDETKIYSSNECVIVEGKDYDELIKAADKLTLHLLGVM